MSEELYRIKPLEWANRGETWFAKGMLYNAVVFKQDNNLFYWEVSVHGGTAVGGAASLELAKDAAEANHRSRLMECLEKV